MRFLFLLLLLFLCSCLHAQNIKVKVDEFTGDTTFTTDLIITDKAAFSASHSGKYFDIIFISVQPICVDNNALVYFLFTDGTRSKNICCGKYNCDGSFIVSTYTYNNKVFPMLKSKLIKSIRLMGVNKIVDFDITPNQADAFKNNFSALYKKK